MKHKTMIWLQFFVGALLIIIAGTKLTRSADVLGASLGLGAGWAGALLLPLATSLPELVTSLRAIMIKAPDLAAGNLLGSALFNLTIIALIDLLQGRNSIFLHARRGLVLSASFSILLLSIAAAGIIYPFPSLYKGWLGLDTLLLIGCYLIGALTLTAHEKSNNHLIPEKNNAPHIKGRKTKKDNYFNFSARRALVQFVVAAAVILFAGVALTDASDIIAVETGLGRTLVGSIMLAVATSLPEVVTTSTAARLGKIDMAVGNVFGANMLNMFILSLMDICYLPGSLFQAVALDHLWTAAGAIILTLVVITGLVKKSPRTIGPLSLYSLFILIGYLLIVALLF